MPDYKFSIPSEAETTFRTGTAPEIFQYKGFAHTADSADSFCRLLKAKAPDALQPVVFVAAGGFCAIVNSDEQSRPQDRITYLFSPSLTAEEWTGIVTDGKNFSVKEMIDFLKRREPGEIDRIEEMIAAARTFRYVIKTEGDFTRDSSQNYVMAIKVGEAEGTVRAPDHITARFPLLEGSDFIQDMEIEVEIHRPKREDGGAPGFRLSCPKYLRYLKKAKEYEAARLERELPGCLIVRGHPGPKS
jgi:hypothetical protein